MAQKRMIDKKISVSGQVDNLSLEAKLIFTWSIPHADDLGLLPFNSKTLKAIIIPIWETRIDSFERWINEILEQKLWTTFEHKEEKYYRIIKFPCHQTLKKDRKPNTYLSDIKTWEEVETLGFQMEDNENPSKDKISKDKRREIENSDFVAVRDYFIKSFLSCKGVEYTFGGGKDGGCIKSFLLRKNKPEYKALVDFYLKDEKSDRHPSLSACLSADTINKFNLKNKPSWAEREWAK